MKHKARINFLIDALMFIAMMAIGGIGFLMKFVLVPGSERWEIYGSNVELFLWGWDRHQWGAFHLILGYILLGLLFLHIVFHWKQIKGLFKNWIPSKRARIVWTSIFTPVCLLCFLFAFFIPFDVVPIKNGEGHGQAQMGRQEHIEKEITQLSEEPSMKDEDDIAPEDHQEKSLEIYGSSSLKELVNKYGVPADSIKKFLGIPLNVSDYEKMGRLRRVYAFHMSDVERFIVKYRQRK